ncbi:putative E3 ubiquitin ligase BIG BROTHER-related [Cocos nucifera]|uniref:Putative E3 ubiquitin ligase BIG BROTHER-related n=1 Tax=Cocos nucifera TaxID=13894 RepID=A0A8K0MXX5_COCNU|nr:putative E3 ubiquitin ligase BIG BROTHER-related [Cocos nucifera]
MENAKESGAGDKIADENPCPTPPPPAEAEAEPPARAASPPTRTPFTSLSQVDADLALARALQEQVSPSTLSLSLLLDLCLRDSRARVSDVLGFGEFFVQERAYMMLRMNGGEGSDYESSDAASYEYEGGEDPDHPIEEAGSDYGEDAFDANDRSMDPAEFESDEAFARALQEAEEREVAVRLMALAEKRGCGDLGDRILGGHTKEVPT